MTARGSVGSKLKNLCRQSRQTGQVNLPTTAVALAAEAGIHFLLASVLAGAEILTAAAPFAVAFTAASGSGVCGGAALLGACFGYLVMLDVSPALRYTSACVLSFAVNFAFYDWKPFRHRWVMPLVAGAFNGFTGFIVQSQAGWRAEDEVRLVLEMALTVAAVWGYRTVLLPVRRGQVEQLLSPERRAGLLFLTATLLVALHSLELWKGGTLGEVLAQLTTLCAAWQGGVAAGGVIGLVVGAAVDLAGEMGPVYAVLCGLAGVSAGFFRGRSRGWAGGVYGLTAGFYALWLWKEEAGLQALGGVCAALPVFFLLPERPVRRLGVWLAPQPAGADLRAQQVVRQQLEATARAFRTLGESLRSAFRAPENDNDVATVFDRTAGRVCRGCALRGKCWQQEYTATFNALNDATPAMVERGRAEAGDFPRYFCDRCIRFGEFLQTVNEELTGLFYRRQYNARVRENRAAVCRQYSQLSDLLDSAASELSRELVPDLLGDRRLRGRIAELGLDVRTAVYRDCCGLVRVEAEGAACRELSRPSRLNDLSELLGIPLRVEREGDGTLALIQQEPLMAVAGVAAKKKNGETVSGDAGTYFKRWDGRLFVLLCDGMGSGLEANRESALAVRLLEQFLQAGVEPKQALTTLSSALALRGEETGGFTTVDLLGVNLFSGEGELFKLGAAPTYVRQGEQVRRLMGKALPAGLTEGDGPDCFELQLRPGDCVLMVSDGICGTGDDSWLKERLAGFDGGSPKDLARELITEGPRDVTDDRTALVIRIERRI